MDGLSSSTFGAVGVKALRAYAAHGKRRDGTRRACFCMRTLVRWNEDGRRADSVLSLIHI